METWSGSVRSRTGCELLCMLLGILILVSVMFLGPIISKISIAAIQYAHLKHGHVKLQPSTTRPYHDINQTTTTLDNVFWFVQVTDIHLQYSNLSRLRRFHHFCNHTLRYVVRPELVLVTGDLVHSTRDEDGVSRQFKEEWEQYRQVLQSSGWFNESLWLDTRGNHDARNVWNSKQSFFSEYSVSGKANRHSSFNHVVHKPFGSYQFIGVDTSLKPGMQRLLSFFSNVDDSDLLHISNLLRNSTGHNMTIAFGHFPLGMIADNISWENRFQQLLTRHPVALYLCGHLHDGLGDSLLARRPHGLLELELVDFKYRSVFRIIVVDHDVFSLVDVSFDFDKPVVVMTHPKPASLLSPFDNWQVTEKLSYIRFFIFGEERQLHSIGHVRVFVDADDVIEAYPISDNITSPRLYIAKWPEDLKKKVSSGLHSLSISANLNGKPTQLVSKMKFSLDGTLSNLPSFFAHVFLHLEFDSVFQAIVTSLLLAFILGFLLLPRFFSLAFFQWDFEISSKEIKENRLKVTIIRFYAVKLVRLVFLKVILMGTDFWTFVTFLLFSLNLVCGVLFFGQVMPGSTAIVFPWGLYYTSGDHFMGHIETKLVDTWFLSFRRIQYSIIPYYLFVTFFTLPKNAFSRFLFIGDHARPLGNESDLWIPRRSRRVNPVYFACRVLLLVGLLLLNGRLYSLLYRQYGIASLLISPGVLWMDLAFSLLILRNLYKELKKSSEENKRN